ncbi:DUF1015 domain-containing protein [Iamia sp. SCSIO 61187]|uniref:DUF1015 family protein n=1 Tax=Iamia sp. SCSIO 61187 TaxID=2722752 RepID=UPI001C6384E9|nr:DUF1015 domain-containing protein [Iamia sp. SCSIO 61187]QYG92823.1 DUF1015 domain-containing protein [Iamia sp. SCSIO 61187]
MPPFQPFAGIRYRADLDPAAVTAPPYDVIDDEDRAALVARSDRNAVHFDLPLESDGVDRYVHAAEVFAGWQADGTLVTDPEPSYTVYRMTFVDDHGRPARTLGVIGALELSRPDEGQILPHEHTTKKAKTDRLDLMRATCANLSPVWMLSLAAGLTALIEPSGAPDAEWTDDDGVGHAVWRITDPDRLAAVSELVGSQPVVVADGHHRYETSLTHRDERRAAAGPDAELASDAFMCLVVELSEDELHVRPIHRLVDGVDADALVAILAERGFTPVGDPLDGDAVAGGRVLSAMAETGAVAVVDAQGGARLLRPRPDAFAGVADLDSARVGHALDGVGAVAVRFQHGVDHVQAAITKGDAGAGILLRPATVAQIEANAHAGERMPAKTTFFHPKPRTGVVFRAC